MLSRSGTRLNPEFAEIVRGFEAGLAALSAGLIVVDGLDTDRRRLLAHGIVGIAEVTCRHWLQSPDGQLNPSAEVLASQIATLAWAGLRGIEAA